MIKMSCNEFNKLSKESAKQRDNCNLCKESKFRVGEKTGYGIIIYKIGGLKNGWFVTLSPKTGGNPKSDFTMQLMPMMHLTHFSQIHSYPNLAENFGIAFSKICKSMSMILMKEEELMSSTEEKSISMPLATYGKCTTWKEKKEHLHIKIFPFRGNIGQPYAVDSSFEKKEIFEDKYGKEFVKMIPVKKTMIKEKRFNQLAKDLSLLLKE